MNKLNMELQDQTQSVLEYLTAISEPGAGCETDSDKTVIKEGWVIEALLTCTSIYFTLLCDGLQCIIDLCAH